jgi:hypothetical protein
MGTASHKVGISVLALSRPCSVTVVLPRLQAVLRGLAEGFSKGLHSVDAGKYYQLPDRWMYTKGWLQKSKEDKSEDGTAMVPSTLHQPCRMVSHCLEIVHWLETFHWLEKMVFQWLENFQTLSMGSSCYQTTPGHDHSERLSEPAQTKQARLLQSVCLISVVS